MSKLGEWIKLIPKGIGDPVAIGEGIVNSVMLHFDSLDDNKKEEIVRRRFICKGCPFMSENAKTSQEYKDLLGEHYKSSREDEHCTFCGCPISTRTASLAKPCGIKTWNKNHPDNLLPLKWDVYGKSD